MKWILDISDDVTEMLAGRDFPARRVLLSPGLGSSKELAVGLSVFGPGDVAETHDHSAEEISYVVRGSGVQTVDGLQEPMMAGSVTHVAPGLPHGTVAGPEGLVVVWVYAPAGSEQRWMPADGGEPRP